MRLLGVGEGLLGSVGVRFPVFLAVDPAGPHLSEAATWG